MNNSDSKFLFLNRVDKIYVYWKKATDIQILPSVPEKWYHTLFPPPRYKSISGRSLGYNNDLWYLREHGESYRYEIDQNDGIVYKLPHIVLQFGGYRQETIFKKNDEEMQLFVDDLISACKDSNLPTIQIKQ